MGYGKKSDFTKLPDSDLKPGPGYNEVHNLNTIHKNSMNQSARNLECTFRNTYDKYKGICYKGME